MPRADTTNRPRPLPARLARALATSCVVGAVRLYQWTLSPVLGRQCRYHPTCSHYMIDAVRLHGPLRGVLRGLRRIARCHPFAKGGYDPA